MIPVTAYVSSLGRPDLHSALTKLHIFRLKSKYNKVVYLDADVLPLRPLSHLFALPNRFSACPDSGWPDCFNSGVMVFEPNDGDFEGMMKLMEDARQGDVALEGLGIGSGNGSFDGADQGLLNEWFSEEGGGGDWNRLSFT
jgi:glycogenin glucosyltransferase